MTRRYISAGLCFEEAHAAISVELWEAAGELGVAVAGLEKMAVESLDGWEAEAESRRSSERGSGEGSVATFHGADAIRG
jgi:hypothetical protein